MTRTGDARGDGGQGARVDIVLAAIVIGESGSRTIDLYGDERSKLNR